VVLLGSSDEARALVRPIDGDELRIVQAGPDKQDLLAA